MAREEAVVNSQDWGRCVGAAACGAWTALVAGFVFLFGIGALYMLIVHTPLLELVSVVWGVGPRAVAVIMIVFIGLLKLFLFFWFFACIFLTVWAYRLRPAKDEM